MLFCFDLSSPVTTGLTNTVLLAVILPISLSLFLLRSTDQQPTEQQGSLAIIWNIQKGKKRTTVYHQLVTGISVFDTIGSVAYTLATVMTDEASGFYESTGNTITCRIQAFMIQLGLTSMTYNLFLSGYFLLVICFNFKEYQFEGKMPYAHAAAIVTGLALAVGGLPFYGDQFSVCYVSRRIVWGKMGVVIVCMLQWLSSLLCRQSISLLRVCLCWCCHETS